MKYVAIEGPTAVIAVEGAFNLCRILEVQAELKLAYQQGCSKVVVDFTKSTDIDSSAQRCLTDVRRKVGTTNFKARNAMGRVLAAMKTAKLDTLWF
jgi:hypothetical protein